MSLQRRIFLRNAAQLAAVAAAGIGCARAADSAYPFSLGVASGAPLPDSVILWTRILGDPLGAASAPIAYAVRWEVAEDAAFARIAARGSASATPALAHSVHVDVKGLRPGRWYWYRFMLGDAVSPVGRTRTAPAAGELPALLKLAVASCQHWEFGSYCAHRHIAAAAPDLVAFVGDYIYEWGPYRRDHPAKALRTNESFTLADYRARYAQYKSDPDLQAAHHAAPWIVTWDDHEVVNDYTGEVDAHGLAGFAARRAAAYQAFYEHMPLRLPQGSDYARFSLFQRYDWGRLARFHVLDDRQYRAPHACGVSNATRAGCATLEDRARAMLGGEQEAWLAQGLRGSPARWNIIAQQTLMAQASQVRIVQPGDGRFWTDGWDGYPAARRRLFDILQTSQAANPLVLSGDVHSFFAAELRRDFDLPASPANPLLAAEFCGTSITSPSRPQERTLKMVETNPHIRYGRSDRRGFILMAVTPASSTAHFIGVDDVHDPASASATLARFTVSAGSARIVAS
ncbi:alkaline phosphatase D family protein [Massilia sp. DWR3-1-1]|uniref:alkaline phosphatase D family protein n=1 Tax=Massilia sp. DWR3-1-1 TaxID=2804559 RepID=UPI003CF377D7